MAMACVAEAQTTKNDNKKAYKYIQVTIQTSGTCQSCKDKIESNIAYEKGVKDVWFCLATGEVTVVFNPKKNTVSSLCAAIQKLGFTAEECIPSHQCNGSCTHACSHDDDHTDHHHTH